MENTVAPNQSDPFVSSLRRKEILDRTSNTFFDEGVESKLQLTSFVGTANEAVVSSVQDIGSVRRAANEHALYQIFRITQLDSFSQLQLSGELFTQLCQTYNVFDQFWDFIFRFGRKTKEIDLGHPSFKYRRFQNLSSSISNPGTPPAQGEQYSRRTSQIPQRLLSQRSFECAHGFHYAVRTERPGKSPWSIRQSAIYQQFDSFEDKIVFTLVSPPADAEERLKSTIQNAGEQAAFINPFELHQCFLSTACQSWGWYIHDLRRDISAQTEKIVTTPVRTEGAGTSFPEFPLKFEVRTHIKEIEDEAANALIILDSLLTTLQEISKLCSTHCRCAFGMGCTCSHLTIQFEMQIIEVQAYRKKVEAVCAETKGTHQLLMDFYDYENARVARKNKKDAAALKILTLILVFYLPFGPILGFFSTQFAKVDDTTGELRIAPSAKWLAAGLPMFLITIGGSLWLYRTHEANEKSTSVYTPDHEGSECNSIGGLSEPGEIDGVIEIESKRSAVRRRFRQFIAKLCSVKPETHSVDEP